MVTTTTKQSKNKALKRHEPTTELPLALEISARDTSPLSRLELLRRRKIARLFAKANARHNAGI